MADLESVVGRLELGPENAPTYGKALWERNANGQLLKRYSLDANGYSIDAQTGEKAWRLDSESRAFTLDGRPLNLRVASAPEPKPDPAHELFGAPKQPSASGSIDALEAQVKRWNAPPVPPSPAERMFGTGGR